VSLEAEIILDRRKLKRRLVWWRFGAVVVGVALALFVMLQEQGISEISELRPHIARYNIEGIITRDRDQIELLDELANSGSVKAVIIYINSPGGTTVGGEALHNSIRQISKKKPVVAVLGTVAASAGYMAGIACDNIIAHANSLTGSMGVIFQWPEFSGILDKVGIRYNEIRSGRLKAVPSPFEPLDNNGRDAMEKMVKEAYEWFRKMVADRRSLDTAAVPGLEEGAVFSGNSALRHGLIDAIGNEDDAVKWLETERNIRSDLPVVERKVRGVGALGGVKRWLHMVASIAGIPTDWLPDLSYSARNMDVFRKGGLFSIWLPG
jgi:protease-4